MAIPPPGFRPGFFVEPHVHGDHADSFYVLAGEAEFTDGDQVVRTRHGFRNAGEDELRLLNIHAPLTGFVARLRGT